MMKNKKYSRRKEDRDGGISIVPKWMDKLIEVEQSLDTGTSQPRVLNEHALTRHFNNRRN